MKMLKIIGKTVFALLIIVCLLSLAYLLYFTELLNIQKVVLKEGRFDVINREYEFEFSNLRNKMFNTVMRFYREQGTEYSNYSSLFSGEVPYTIDIELKDQENKIIKKDTINQNSSIPASHGNEYFEWTLMQFNAKKGEKYKVRILFNSDKKAFDEMKKEIYIQQDYDYAAKPFWYLFQRTFLIIFIATLMPALIVGVILWRKKKKGTK